MIGLFYSLKLHLQVNQGNVSYLLICCVFEKNHHWLNLSNFFVWGFLFFFLNYYFSFPFSHSFFNFSFQTHFNNEVNNLQIGNRQKSFTVVVVSGSKCYLCFRLGCCQGLWSLMAIIWRAIPVLSVTIRKFLSRYDFTCASLSFCLFERRNWMLGTLTV